VPFLAVGLAFAHLSRPLAWVKRHFIAITVIPAVVLGGFGVLLILNRLSWVTARLTDLLDAVGLRRLIELG